jgi:hypothetical protein
MRVVLAAAAAAAVLAGCAPAGVNTVRLGNSVICGPTEVIMPSQAVTSTIVAVGEAEYGRVVCEAVRGVDARGIVEPMRVRVILPAGETIVRVRQAA